MADVKLERAKKVYATVCEVLDDRNWTYTKRADDLTVKFSVSGDDIPIDYTITVDVERQLLRAISFLPFQMSDDRRIDGAIATCHASHNLIDGCFAYDLSDGTIVYKINASFFDNEISKAVVEHLIDCTSAVVDRYNDTFLALNKGTISITDFLTANK